VRVVQQTVSQCIRSYRFYFIDSGGHIAQALDVESSCDAEACELAARMLAEQSRYPGIEVWERARMVGRVPVAPMQFDRLYRVTAQQLRWIATRDATPLRDRLLALSRDIDRFADKVTATGSKP
jgi:hypothetical protein